MKTNIYQLVYQFNKQQSEYSKLFDVWESFSDKYLNDVLNTKKESEERAVFELLQESFNKCIALAKELATVGVLPKTAIK